MSDGLKDLMKSALLDYEAVGVDGSEGARAMRDGLARIEELEAELDALKAKPAWSAALQDLFDLGNDYQVDCATKEEWAQRAFNAEAKLAELKGQDDE